MAKEPKSKRYIREAFLALRAQKDVERITVVELCEKADINKSTFYAYYHDIYDLSDQLQFEVMQRIIAGFDDPEEIMSDPAQFTRNILEGCRPDQEMIHLLFSGSQQYKLPMKMEEAIKEHFYSIRPWHKGDMHHELMLSYKIFGSYFAYVMNTAFDPQEKIDYISYLSGSFATSNV